MRVKNLGHMPAYNVSITRAVLPHGNVDPASEYWKRYISSNIITILNPGQEATLARINTSEVSLLLLEVVYEVFYTLSPETKTNYLLFSHNDVKALPHYEAPHTLLMRMLYAWHLIFAIPKFIKFVKKSLELGSKS